MTTMADAWADLREAKLAYRRMEAAVKLTAFYTSECAEAARDASNYTLATVKHIRNHLEDLRSLR